MAEPWRRHELLFVSPVAWNRTLRDHRELAALPYLEKWADRGWPLIVRRRNAHDNPALAPAAISLPPVCGKQRIALQIDPRDIVKQMPTPNLRDLRMQIPISWKSTVAKVLELAEKTGVEPFVFGGLLWESLTGLPYLSASSDLDLCWPVNHPAQATDIVQGLAAIDEKYPVRIDGEIILPDGGGVNWRELQNGAAEVIVKTMSCVRLCPITALFGNTLACS